MLIYNRTFLIDDSVHEDALFFLKSEYIPEAIRSGVLLNPRLCKIHAAHEEEGWSYSLQFHVENRQSLNDWHSSEGNELLRKIAARYRDKVLSFDTLLEEVDL